MSAAHNVLLVRFADGHELAVDADPDPAARLEELRQVMVAGRWFRIPGSARLYAPHAIVSVDVTTREEQQRDDPGLAQRLGEVVGEAIQTL